MRDASDTGPMTGGAPGPAARDAAYAELVALESRRLGLERSVRTGDPAAAVELAALRPQLARQAVAAADLDAASDLAVAPGRDADAFRSPAEARLVALCARRLEIARDIEAHAEAIVTACRTMIEQIDLFAADGFREPAIEAELHRFRDRFCFYLDTRLDFMTGARGLAGHPSYRKLAEVMLDGDAFLKLYRRGLAP